MKKLLVFLVVLAGVMVVVSRDAVLQACGSKFLVSSRGARYQRILASIKPTNILWFYEQDENTPEDERWNPDCCLSGYSVRYLSRCCMMQSG